MAVTRKKLCHQVIMVDTTKGHGSREVSMLKTHLNNGYHVEDVTSAGPVITYLLHKDENSDAHG
jgi:hypothetical protein